MKAKVLQIRIDEPFINQVEYLKKVNGYSSNSETVRKTIEKEYRKESNIIRCSECKHWSANTQFCAVFSEICTAHRMPPNGYCSEAEKAV